MKHLSSILHVEEHKKLKKIRKLLRFVIAVFLPVFLALLLQFPEMEFTRGSVTLLFLAIVAISAGNGGYKSGFITTLLSALAINYYFTYPYYLESFTTIHGISTLILFLLEGIFLSVIIDILSKRTEIDIYKARVKEQKEKILQLESENISLRNEIRSRDEFLSIASHELKTPLTSMLLQTQHALHSIRNVSLAHFSIESLLKMLETVENQTKRLSRMINDLLNVSLITTGNLNIEPEEINLNILVAQVVEEFSKRLERDNIEVVFREEDIVMGNWDKLRIEQAVTNIISNAIRYGQGKPIEVTVKKYYSNAQIIIVDHGIGISKTTQKKIFDLFERGVAQESYKGLGVGLYITRQIVDAHGGTIKVMSKEGRGSTFIIVLPITTPEPKNDQPAETAQE